MTIVATNPTNLELKDAKSDPSSASTPRWTPTWSHGCFPESFDTRRGRNVRKSIDNPQSSAHVNIFSIQNTI
jgi:hypothetical protein